MYILDTCIISELRKKKPHPLVLAWMNERRDDELFLSVVTIGEIEKGIEKKRLSDENFANELTRWLDKIITDYNESILKITIEISRQWGILASQIGHDGADLLIAATALFHGYTVATRNTSHFIPAGVQVCNPFDDHLH